ncbi:hypothetical protein ACHAWF_001075 [Thalassiosira exigua]
MRGRTRAPRFRSRRTPPSRQE